MKTVIEMMAREAEGDHVQPGLWAMRTEDLERFAELVRADERERIYFQTSSDFVKAAIADEREACAKVCEAHWEIDGTHTAKEFAAAIRARGQA